METRVDGVRCQGLIDQRRVAIEAPSPPGDFNKKNPKAVGPQGLEWSIETNKPTLGPRLGPNHNDCGRSDANSYDVQNPRRSRGDGETSNQAGNRGWRGGLHRLLIFFTTRNSNKAYAARQALSISVAQRVRPFFLATPRHTPSIF